jgi:hypothetical protein
MRTCHELGVCQARECYDCPMHSVRVIQDTAAQWGLQHEVPGVLRAPGAQCPSRQATSQRHVGCDSQVQGSAWPGSDFGVRPPEFDETGLSHDEAIVAMRECLV